MLFAKYEFEAGRFARYPNRGNNLTYAALGLAGEAGEFCDKVKKVIRDDGGVLNDGSRRALGKELGDVLWYAAACAYELGMELSTVAADNIMKLASRAARGVLGGSGDDR